LLFSMVFAYDCRTQAEEKTVKRLIRETGERNPAPLSESTV
jgi:hypothetical protein